MRATGRSNRLAGEKIFGATLTFSRDGTKNEERREHTITRESQHGQAGCSANIYLLSGEQESEEDLPASPDPSAQRQAWDEVKLVR